MAGRFPPPGSGLGSMSFEHPREIVEAPIERAAKLKLLEEWEQDLRRMLATSDENMPSTHPGETGETLRAVSDAFIALGAPAADRPGVPTAEGTKARAEAKEAETKQAGKSR
jgi:hypothetical protein